MKKAILIRQVGRW